MKDLMNVYTRYTVQVDTLEDAWATIMRHIDLIGPRPYIEIAPVVAFQGEDEFKIFDVTIASSKNAEFDW